MGPLPLKSRLYFLDRILTIQNQINANSQNPPFLLINKEEETRIRELIEQRTFPQRWTGDEPTGDIMLDKKYSDGSTMQLLFRDLVGKSTLNDL